MAQRDEPKLTTGEAAALLHRHAVTLRQWRRKGIGPKPVKVGGQWRYREDEVVDYSHNGEPEQVAS